MEMSLRSKQWQWIHKEATINELIDKYPQEWEVVHSELSNIYATSDVNSLQKHIKKSLYNHLFPFQASAVVI